MPNPYFLWNTTVLVYLSFPSRPNIVNEPHVSNYKEIVLDEGVMGVAYKAVVAWI